jgi:hypothetical protein
MRFVGDEKNLLDSLEALKEAKKECNKIANQEGLRLKDCKIFLNS